MQDVMDTIAQIVTQDTAPAPEGGPGGTRLKKQVAPDRRTAIADTDRRHGRKSSAKTFHGFQEHCVLDLESPVPREVVVRPAHEPEHEAVALRVETLARPPGLLQLAIDWGYMTSPRMGQWADQGVYFICRRWLPAGPGFSKDACTLDLAHGTVTWPGGQTVPMVPGKTPSFPPAPVRRVHSTR